MSWLAVLKLMLVLADRVARIVQERSLLAAGEDRALAKALAAFAERLWIARQIAAETVVMRDVSLDRELGGNDP
jgi:hypothetical protein